MYGGVVGSQTFFGLVNRYVGPAGGEALEMATKAGER